MTLTELDELEIHSALWIKLRTHYEARLASLRVQNDQPLDGESTATLRGRISEIKLLINLGDPQRIAQDKELKFTGAEEAPE